MPASLPRRASRRRWWRDRSGRGPQRRLVRQGVPSRMGRHQQCRHLRRQGRQAAGDATNVVTDYASIKGEARSPEAAFATTIAKAYQDAFAKAQAEVKDASGATAEVKFEQHARLSAVQAGREEPGRPARRQGGESLGLEPTYLVLERRPRCQLARQARHSDRHHRRRPIRDPHGERVRRPSGVRPGLPTGGRPGDARILSQPRITHADDSSRIGRAGHTKHASRTMNAPGDGRFNDPDSNSDPVSMGSKT